jgi:uncharacterized protein YndB with AHSA1/START domain
VPTTTGTYDDANGQPMVRFERTFPNPVQEVWEAISDPAQLEQWFPTSVEFERLAAGAAIVFRFEQDDYPPLSGKVLDVSPPERLSFTWGDDVLTFELRAIEGETACRLSFTVALDSADKAARDSAGWEQCLDALVAVAGGRSPQRPMAREPWQVYYEEYKRLGLPANAAIP